MRECDKFCSDDVRQLLATQEHGVYFGGIPEAIYADLGELAAGLKPGRENAGERIFSMNMGIAVDDMVTAKVLYELAKLRGAGTRRPLAAVSDDRAVRPASGRRERRSTHRRERSSGPKRR